MISFGPARRFINEGLALFNLRVDSLTPERQESKRLADLVANGHFSRAIYPLPSLIAETDPAQVLAAVERYRESLEKLVSKDRNDAGYSFENDYFSSPDAEVYYSLLRSRMPGVVVEIGSGNSTRIARQAIRDGTEATHLISIDPSPRIDIAGFSDRVIAAPVETLSPDAIVGWLGTSGCLFIDSSHILRTGTDLPYLFGNVLPHLPAGTLIHIHDIFLPYEYPQAWVVDERWGFNEQYLVHAVLMFSRRFKVLWAGHYLQRTMPGFSTHFPHLNGKRAQSLWLEVV